MTNEELLQATLTATVQRLGKQATQYEAEIANLNAQIAALNHQVQHLTNVEEMQFSDSSPSDLPE